ncbi:2463_t:CDS:2, partial [Gigaspora rosea]
MVQVPDSKFFKGALLDSFEQKGYVYSKSPPATEPSPPSKFSNFFEKAKNSIIIITSAFAIGGLVLTPIIVVGLIEAIGFGAGGIAAGSFAAWLMSLNGGATAAGSLVAILQSIGAAGLTAGATVGTGTAGATIMAGLGKLVSERLDSNREGQAQLDEFVKVYDEGNKDEGNEDEGNEDERNEDKNSEKGSTTVVFEIRDKLLNNDEAFDNFLKTFTLTYNASKQLVNKKQQFKFFVDETCVMNIAEKKLETLNDHLVKNYGAECVDKQAQSRTIMLN